MLLIEWTKHDSCFYFNSSVLNDATRTLLVFNLAWWALTFMFVFPPKGKRCLYISSGLVAGIVLFFVLPMPLIDPPNAAWSLEEGAIHVFKDNAQVDLPPMFSPGIMRLSPVYVRLHQRCS